MCFFSVCVFFALLFIFESEKIRFQIQNQISKNFFLILKIISCCGFPKPPATVNGINRCGWPPTTVNAMINRGLCLVTVALPATVNQKCPRR
jgi:hypothetical protein